MKSKIKPKKTIALLAGLIFVIAVSTVIFRYTDLMGKYASGNSTEALSGELTAIKNTTLSAESSIVKITENEEKVLGYSCSDASEFEYKLKDTYTSREELLQERTDLSACYKVFINNKNAETVNQAADQYKELMNTIKEKLKAFPPDEEEVIQTKKQLLKDELFYRRQFLLNASEEFENSPDDSAKAAEYADCKEKCEQGDSIEKEYEQGEISLDEALAQLGIEYTAE